MAIRIMNHFYCILSIKDFDVKCYAYKYLNNLNSIPFLLAGKTKSVYLKL